MLQENPSGAVFIVIRPGNYGTLAWRMAGVPELGPEFFTMNVEGSSPVEWLHITSHDEFHVIPVEPLFVPGHGIVFKMNGEKQSLGASSILSKVEMTVEEVRDLLKELKVESPEKDEDVMSAAVNNLFAGVDDAEQKQILADYEAPEGRGGVDDDILRDPHMADVLDELVLHSQDNYDEVKTLQCRLKSARFKALEIIRREAGRGLKRKRLAAARANVGSGRRIFGQKKAARPTKPKARPTDAGPVVAFITPQVVESLSPPGFRIRVDVPGCRWKVFSMLMVGIDRRQNSSASVHGRSSHARPL